MASYWGQQVERDINFSRERNTGRESRWKRKNQFEVPGGEDMLPTLSLYNRNFKTSI